MVRLLPSLSAGIAATAVSQRPWHPGSTAIKGSILLWVLGLPGLILLGRGLALGAANNSSSSPQSSLMEALA